jgi:hypothetical protein
LPDSPRQRGTSRAPGGRESFERPLATKTFSPPMPFGIGLSSCVED